MRALMVLLWCISWQAISAEQIYVTATQAPVSQQQLVEHLKQQSWILLGEVHDEPLHHLRRAELIETLSERNPVVVAEQLEAGKQVVYTEHLTEGLAQAGFDAKIWDWSVYSPLFSTLAAHDIHLMGGNLPLETVRQIAQQGEAALPESLRTKMKDAPLSATGEATLISDLESGHCGHLPKPLLPNFVLAQRARDTSMLSAMQATNHNPVILLAGNGHVRKDYGVPTLLPPDKKKSVSVGFLQLDMLLPEEIKAYQTQYDYIWLTGAVDKADACAAFDSQK